MTRRFAMVSCSASLALAIAWSSAGDLAARIGRDVARWKSVAKDAGIRPD